MTSNIIEARLITPFEKELFNAALANINDSSNKLRLNNFAYAIRELSRHFLKRLAPDEEVKKCPWYKNIIGDPNKISRRERIIYAIQGGLDNNYIRNKLKIDPTQTLKKFSNIIDKLNSYTHINHNTFNVSNSDIEISKSEILEVLMELFSFIETSKKAIVEPLQEQIDDEVFAKAIFETSSTIDACATHHIVEDVEVYEHEITIIDSNRIHITAHGNIGVELQFGSNGDLKRGDGALNSHSFPFTCQFHCETISPETLINEEFDLEVDDSSWFE